MLRSRVYKDHQNRLINNEVTTISIFCCAICRPNSQSYLLTFSDFFYFRREISRAVQSCIQKGNRTNKFIFLGRTFWTSLFSSGNLCSKVKSDKQKHPHKGDGGGEGRERKGKEEGAGGARVSPPPPPPPPRHNLWICPCLCCIALCLRLNCEGSHLCVYNGDVMAIAHCSTAYDLKFRR